MCLSSLNIQEQIHKVLRMKEITGNTVLAPANFILWDEIKLSHDNFAFHVY